MELSQELLFDVVGPTPVLQQLWNEMPVHNSQKRFQMIVLYFFEEQRVIDVIQSYRLETALQEEQELVIGVEQWWRGGVNLDMVTACPQK